MLLNEFLEIYAKHPCIKEISRRLSDGNTRRLALSGLNSSARSLVFGSVYHASPAPIVVIMDDAESAAYCYNDLTAALGHDNIAVLPSSFKKSVRHGEKDTANEILRTDALNLLSSGQPFVVITSPEGLAERVVSRNLFEGQRITLRIGESISQDDIAGTLLEYKFEQVDFVYEPGQFSIRGSIMDIFSYSNELPYRIDFFGDEIESIRTFDIDRQLSLDKRQEVSILPNLTGDGGSRQSVPVFDFIPRDTLLCISNAAFVSGRIDQIFNDGTERYADTPAENILISGKRFLEEIEPYRIMEFGGQSTSPACTIEFHVAPQPLFHKNFDLIAEQLKDYQSKGYSIYIASDSKKQTDRIAAIFNDRNDGITFTPLDSTVHEGFIDHDLKLCCLTDHQIFDRYHKFSLRSDVTRNGKVAMTLKELNQLQIGDYVVHIDHGIGRFGGLVTTDNGGRKQEVIKLIYRDDDVIFVSIHGLHRISKYKGKDGEPPRISKIGSGAWERLKERTKAKVKDIARDLIMLYAARKAEKGFEFSHDSYLQQELEASFIYEDTPDQMKSTADIKHDMESPLPMDRLICGDVGFGKTELAIRAAFKAVTDNKQVAVLVPTTVLALQHYKTFTERLKNFPCRIEYLSRAKKPAEVKSVKEQLKNGHIDILIGTHKIVGKDIVFKDLGLLIIDEEQKFGVSIKEKLKRLKVNVDTLTMTATPIPRTLQFSLMGARDLSILTTPPPNRYPVQTELCTFNDEIVREAIRHEMERNGQVFFINNRIQNMYLIEQKLRALVPEARIATAHGQMPSEQLEQTVMDFIDYEYDVLIATSVVESGVDIPNVNTIIINNAQMFGLSDLHQLRGRVGRSNRKAYCYLIAPPLELLTNDARRRLQAIEAFADLGSGFNIAMQDLDIRGAGNILGAEQSGFITDLGYDTYQKILNEAMTELRDEEFSELFADKIKEDASYVSDCQIESDLELLLPSWYIENVPERMSLYRELDNIKTEKELQGFASRLEDRFGKIPPQAQSMMNVVRLRWIAQKFAVERLVLKNGRMTAHLVSNETSPFYRSKEFGRLLSYFTAHPYECQLAQRDNQRMFIIKNITSVEAALKVFGDITLCEA